jgi:hypothetical protein
MHVEDAVRAGDDLHHTERVFPLREDARHQTGGVWPCASGDAVLDPDMVALDHRFDSTTRRTPSVVAREEPRGQTVARLLSNVGSLVVERFLLLQG